MPRLDMLYHHCADMGLGVEWVDLGPSRRGEYVDGSRLIRLHRGLTRAQATATLAHEIGHAEFGHSCSTPATERRAWQYGASLVVSVADYQRAERIVGHHPNALAAELGVTRRLIEAWRDWYRTSGLMVTPREG